jgi:hypothetical protein
MMLLLVIEIFPFRPIYGAFRPLWSNYSDNFNKNPIIGQINTAWLGWGEEGFLLGKQIEKRLAPQLLKTGESIHIYQVYSGVWLVPPNFIQSETRSDQPKLTKSDYYIINRSSIVQGYSSPFKDLEPILVLSYRGYIQAWLYRGDQLKSK